MATSGNGLEVKRFEPTDVAGEQTINPMLDWMKNLDCVSEFLMTSVNGLGSISIDLDFPLLAAKILSMVAKSYGEFHGTISGSDRLEMAAGHIYVGTSPYDVGAHSKKLSSDDSGKGWMATITTSGMSVTWGDLPANCVTSTSLTLPLCGAVKTGTRWVPYQYHLGSWVIPFPPACLISGYDATKTQSLDHSSGTLVWTTYKRCGGQS